MEERAKTVNEGLLQYCNMHFTNRVINLKQQNKPLPKDPYNKNWVGHDFRYIFKEVEGDIIYKHIYKPFAAWHHWSPLSFERTLKSEDKEIQYTSSSTATSATILASSFQCLCHTAQLVNNHLQLSFGPRLKEIHSELITWHKNQLTSSQPKPAL